MSRKTISRRDFIKGIAAGAVALIILGALDAYDVSANARKQLARAQAESVASVDAARYESTKSGAHGDVTVTLSVEGRRITDVNIVCAEELSETDIEAVSALKAQLLETQGAEPNADIAVDDAIKEAVADCLAQMNP